MIETLFQPLHLIIIAAIVLLFFGGRWFASLGQGFSAAIQNFRRAVRAKRGG